MSRSIRLVVLVAVLALVGAACGDDGSSESDDSDESTSAASDEPTESSDESVEPTDGTEGEAEDAEDAGDDGGTDGEGEDGDATDDSGALPDAGEAPASSVVAPMQQFYGDDPDAALGFDAVLVNAYWFLGADGFRVVQFHPIEPSLFTNVCPGASLNVGTTFEHVANASTGGDACADFPTLVGGDVAAYDCNGVLTLRTDIPNDAAGDFLYASMETGVTGDVQGYTSVVPPGGEPDFDVAGCTRLA